ncbi:MAG: hypothetical protein MJZ98_00685 [Paludibacteraceae bacterium]|nr:hypothetical protein [Paludibacteraceae bacterium]
MSVLSWGKPTIQVKKYVNGVLDPSENDWITLSTPVQGTTNLDTADGDTVQALEEGGGVVDSYTNKSQFTLSMELFVKKNETKPIDDNDGVVLDNYAVRLVPEDAENNGYLFKKCAVTARETWTSADGGRWVYTFTALVPDDGGKMVRPYKAQ